jgi:hypothetical protein
MRLLAVLALAPAPQNYFYLFHSIDFPFLVWLGWLCLSSQYTFPPILRSQEQLQFAFFTVMLLTLEKNRKEDCPMIYRNRTTSPVHASACTVQEKYSIGTSFLCIHYTLYNVYIKRRCLYCTCIIYNIHVSVA